MILTLIVRVRSQDVFADYEAEKSAVVQRLSTSPVAACTLLLPHTYQLPIRGGESQRVTPSRKEGAWPTAEPKAAQWGLGDFSSAIHPLPSAGCELISVTSRLHHHRQTSSPVRSTCQCISCRNLLVQFQAIPAMWNCERTKRQNICPAEIIVKKLDQEYCPYVSLQGYCKMIVFPLTQNGFSMVEAEERRGRMKRMGGNAEQWQSSRLANDLSLNHGRRVESPDSFSVAPCAIRGQVSKPATFVEMKFTVLWD